MTNTMNEGARMYGGGTENVDTLPADGAVVVSCTGPSTHCFGVVLSRETNRWGTQLQVSWSDGTESGISYCVGHIESGHPHATKGIGVYTLGPAAAVKAAALMVREMHARRVALLALATDR